MNEWLNYHHLLYFRTIVRAGSLSAAARELRLTHSTLSAQLKALESFLGEPLFERRGRRLLLTAFGRQVEGYASEISGLGEELLDFARGRPSHRRVPFRVGVLGSMPRSIVHGLLAPALAVEGVGPFVLHQNELARLTAMLGAGELDLVLSDVPPQAPAVKLHAHRLFSTPLFLYGSPALAAKFGKRFPHGLEGAPVLMPETGALRRSLERWFTDRKLRVQVAGEFNDSGLMRVFGGKGLGLFAVRAVLRTEVEEAHGARPLGRLTGLVESFYALSMERRVKHPGVAAILEAAER